MAVEFILSSEDFGDDLPRHCVLLSEPKGRLRAESSYLWVAITPCLTSRFEDGPPSDFDKLLLAPIGPVSIDDVGVKDVLVDVVLAPDYSTGVIDEATCSRIGVGGLHPVSTRHVQRD